MNDIIKVGFNNAFTDHLENLHAYNITLKRKYGYRRKKKSFAGINMGTSRRSWHELKSLGFITQRAFVNFCRYKDMQEFTKRNLVTEINTVSSLADVSNM